VNIDHAATLRQARYRGYPRLRGEMVEPDPVALALEAERAGADGITVHPREDARHIQRDDVVMLRRSPSRSGRTRCAWCRRSARRFPPKEGWTCAARCH